MNFTLRHAHAIIDMDNHGFSEGLGPSEENDEAWEELVRVAEEKTGRQSDLTHFLESKRVSRWV